MSLRIVPSEDRPTDAKNTNFGPAAPSAPGLIDTLRTGKPPISISSKVNDIHPLENRLKNWDATQRQTQLETYRRLFGAAAPIKRELELDIVKKTDFRPEILGNGAIPSPGQDILLSRETTVEWEDIYGDFDDSRPTDFHTEMEKQMGI
ncbi:UMP1 [Brettanomyces bruxellensis]|uniref:DEBR0S4_00738g1_1 n=1 Tax=Dekkera bruxellensis TaxID=5007 RepID=A0A7D9H0C9_DEKBR|nr:UMP1 [Brettanomyces bruxellensis]